MPPLIWTPTGTHDGVIISVRARGLVLADPGHAAGIRREPGPRRPHREPARCVKFWDVTAYYAIFRHRPRTAAFTSGGSFIAPNAGTDRVLRPSPAYTADQRRGFLIMTTRSLQLPDYWGLQPRLEPTTPKTNASQ